MDHSHGRFSMLSYSMAMQNRGLICLEEYLEGVGPLKDASLSWTPELGMILTQINLQMRGQCLLNRCVMCCAEETADHLLLHCLTVRNL